MKKLTDIKYKELIQCKTSEQATLLCTKLHEMGKVWENNTSYINNNWDYNEKTCYDIHENNICDVQYAIEYSYNITQFEDVDLVEENILDKAKRLYPVGTRFISARGNDYEYEVQINSKFRKNADGAICIESAGNGTIYYDGKWAKIIVIEFILPEKWCVKRTNSCINKWLNEHSLSGFSNYSNLDGDYLHFPLFENNKHLYNTIQDGYTEITLEQFEKYVLKTNTNIKNKFPFQLNRAEAKEIIDIACSTWKSKLIKRWAEPLLIDDNVMIDESFYKEMRNACTSEQDQLFDTIFGSDNKEVNLQDPSTFNNLQIFKKDGNIDTSLIAILGSDDRKTFWLNSQFEWKLDINNGSYLLTIKSQNS